MSPEAVGTPVRVLAGKRVVVVMGRPVIDVQLRVPTIPQAGEKVLTDQVSTMAGGVDGNFAASLASLGAHVAAAGSAGDDAVADVDRNSLTSFGVDVRWDVASGGPSTVCYVTVDQSGERTVVVAYPGDEERVSEGVVRAVLEVSAERWDLAYLGVLRQTHRPVLAPLRSAAGVVAVTLEHSDWSDDWLGEAAGSLDVVFVAHETYEAHSRTLLALQRKHRWTLVVTAGASGSRLVGPDGSAAAPAVPVGGAVTDTTGAGDAFASAFCAAWLLGDRGADALRIANWYAAQKIVLPGPRAFAPAAEFSRARNAIISTPGDVTPAEHLTERSPRS